jgi:hypothetical protein
LLAAATAAAAITVALVVYGLWPEQSGQPVAWTDLAPRVGRLTVTRETRRLFRSRSQLDRYLRQHGVTRSPALDFERRQLLLVSPGPRSSTGYALRVEDVREQEGRIVVTVRERTPRLGDHVVARVTFPYRLLSLPADKDVYVDWKGR